MVWRFLAAALLAVSAAGCTTECAGGTDLFIAAGDTYAGVDPREALAALPARALPSWWLHSGETTTVTITATPSGDPSRVVADCTGNPARFSIPTIFALQSDDGRLDGSFGAELPADLSANMTLPAAVRGQMPLTTLDGTGVVDDAYLDPTVNELGVYLQINAAAVGAAYGSGYLYLVGRDTPLVGILNVDVEKLPIK